MALVHVRIWHWSTQTQSFWGRVPRFVENTTDLTDTLLEAAHDALKGLP